MATEEHARAVENSIGYSFHTKSRLQQALTAAGAVDDHHDGNRRLAQFGSALTEFLLVYIGFEADGSRGRTTDLRCRISNTKQRAAVAQRTGIDRHIRYDHRPGSQSSSVLAKAVNAIIGATFLDCGGNMTVALKVMLRLGIFNDVDDGTMSSLDQTLDFPDIANTIFRLFESSPASRNDTITVAVTESNSSSTIGNLNQADVTNLLAQPALHLHDSAQLQPEPNISEALQFNLESNPDDFSQLDLEPDIHPERELLPSLEFHTEPNLYQIAQLRLDNNALNIAPPLPDGGFYEILDFRPEQSSHDNTQFLPETEFPCYAFDFSSPLTTLSNGNVINDLTSTSGHSVHNGLSLSNPGTSQNHQGLGTKRKSQDLTITAMKRRKSTHSNQCQVVHTTFAEYLSQEATKCKDQGLPIPQETYFSSDIRARILGLGRDRQEALERLALYIASPRSLTALQEILKNWRKPTLDNQGMTANGISPAARFDLIKRLDCKAAYSQLARRLHVLELFKECGGSETQSVTGLIITTELNIEQARKRPGNPIHAADAEVSKNMMRQVFPDMQPDTAEYNDQHLIMKKLRKLGQRLYILETTFGKGILGLIPVSGMTTSLDIGISDNMIIKPAEDVFKTFVSILNDSQGEILCQFSRAVSGIVEALMCDSIQNHPQFSLEKATPGKISEYPKGSKVLLQLIS